MLQHPDIRERISIHAPREGSDPTATACLLSTWNFNPRSP